MKKIIIVYALIFVLVVNLVLALSLNDIIGFILFEKPPKSECMHACKETFKTTEEECKTEDSKQEVKACHAESKSQYKSCKTCCNNRWHDCKEKAKQAKDACKESGNPVKECSDLAKEIANNCEFNCNVQQCTDPCFVNPSGECECPF